MKTIARLILAAALACFATAADEPAETKPIKVEQAASQIEKGVQLLDVRTKEEWDEGHLAKAKLVTLSDDGFDERAKAVLDPAKPVIVYCRSGNRSAKAVEKLREAGFTSVRSMAGGIVAWEKEGKPVVK